MKTIASFFVAALVLFAATSFAQDNNPMVETVSFITVADGAPYVQLNWKKGTDNTIYYTVEKSIDGNTFKQVAIVFTSEDAQFAAYKYRDKSLATSGDAVYYRIGMVSEQKELVYLPVQKVAVAASEKIASIAMNK